MRIHWKVFLHRAALALCAVTLGAMHSAPISAQANRVTAYVNPLDVSIADPHVLKDDDGMYYLYGTTPHWSSSYFEVYSSPDLVTWQRHGLCYERQSTSWGQDNYWAPEVIKWGDTYYLYYTAYNQAANVRSICVATSDSPIGPFIDQVEPIMPLNRSYIDGNPFYDEASGRHYLYVMDENARPPKIWVARLSEDLLSLDSDLTECLTATQPWEANWVEGSVVFERNGTYYMMYSGNGWTTENYAVGYATASSPIGPWTKHDGNPILFKNAKVSGPGHHSVTFSPDGTEMFMAYHTHLTFAGGWQRQLAIDRLGFVPQDSGPDLLSAFNAPTWQPQLLPSGATPRFAAASDDFTGVLDRTRWQTFGEVPDKWEITNGQLRITTVDGDLWTDRTDAKGIFLQTAPGGDFRIETTVEFQPLANFEQAFLLVFGDQSNYIKIANVYAYGRRIEATKEIGGAFEGSNVANPFPAATPLQFRIEKTGNEYVLSYRSASTDWAHLITHTADLGPQVKVGIGAFSPASGQERTAAFDHFTYVQVGDPPVPTHVAEAKWSLYH